MMIFDIIKSMEKVREGGRKEENGPKLSEYIYPSIKDMEQFSFTVVHA